MIIVARRNRVRQLPADVLNVLILKKMVLINVPEPVAAAFRLGEGLGDHPGGWSKATEGSTSACVGQPAFVRRMRTRRPRTAPRLSNENPTLGSDEASVVWKTFSHGKKLLLAFRQSKPNGRAGEARWSSKTAFLRIANQQKRWIHVRMPLLLQKMQTQS